MEALYNPKQYEELAPRIESLGPTAIWTANRWSLGWPDRVTQLIVAGQLMPKLQAQTELEREVLAEEMGFKHLSRTEILQMHGVTLEAPRLD